MGEYKNNSINQNIEISLNAIDEIVKIAAEEIEYKNLKMEMFKAASFATISNLKKYNEPTYFVR